MDIEGGRRREEMKETKLITLAMQLLQNLPILSGNGSLLRYE